MEKIVFETAYTYDHTKNKGTYNTQPSLTVPDMALTIQELMNQYTIDGMQSNVSFDDDDIDFNDIISSRKNFDLVDIENASNYIEAIRQKQEDEQKSILLKKKSEESEKIKKALEFFDAHSAKEVPLIKEIQKNV
jgi:hypothetical protein